MEYIKKLLDSLDKLEPIDTGVLPSYKRNPAIKAVVFDIYGTMLISSSGDVDQAEISETNLASALKAANVKVIDPNSNTLDHILKDFQFTIKVCHDTAKQNHIPYPEIDILSIWEIVLIHARRKKLIDYSDDVDVMLITCVFEFLSNRVYPMPYLKKTITSLQKKNIPLGIVSNAQSYTPVLMNYYLNNKFKLDEAIDNFDPELIVFSYKLGRGKPDTCLFNDLIKPLKRKYNLEPHEVLFVGNDMLKDVYTSKRVGFQTALFAGDARSLRMREDDARVVGLKPDYVITELKQILEILN